MKNLTAEITVRVKIEIEPRSNYVELLGEDVTPEQAARYEMAHLSVLHEYAGDIHTEVRLETDGLPKVWPPEVE